jgi:ribosomal protein S18 acetylase RimI-like enzyme
MLCVITSDCTIDFTDASGRRVGFLTFGNMNKNTAEIIRLMVVEDLRGRGIGSMLLEVLFGLYPFSIFTLEAMPDSDGRWDDLIRFYRRHGFEIREETEVGTSMARIKLA